MKCYRKNESTFWKNDKIISARKIVEFQVKMIWVSKKILERELRKAMWEILSTLACRRLYERKWLIIVDFMLIIGLESVNLVLF